MSNLLSVFAKSVSKEELSIIAEEFGVKATTKAKTIAKLEEILEKISYKRLISNYNSHHELFGETDVTPTADNRYTTVKNTYDFVSFTNDLLTNSDEYCLSVADNFIVNGFTAYSVDIYKSSFNYTHFEMVKEAVECSKYDEAFNRIDTAFAFNLPSDARIFTLYSNEDYMYLQALLQGKRENLSKYFDGLFISGSHSGTEDTLILFQDGLKFKDKAFLNIKNLNDEIEYKVNQFKDYYETDKDKAKKETYGIFKIPVTQSNVIYTTFKGVPCYEFTQDFMKEILRDDSPYRVKIASNRLFRTYLTPGVRPEDNTFCVFNLSSMYPMGISDTIMAAIKERVRDILTYGIRLFDRVYKPLMQSAAQKRTGNFMFMSEDYKGEIKEVREQMAHYSINTMAKNGKSITKIDNACSLCLTSTKSIGSGYSFALIDDPELPPTLRKVYVYDEKTHKVTVEERLIHGIVPGDGGTACSFKFAFKVNLIQRRISKAQYKYLIRNFTTIDALYISADAKLKKIFNKLSFAFQIRGGLIKGLVVAYPLEKEGYDVDLVIPKSMRKSTPEDFTLEEIEIEIAAIDKPKYGMGSTNFQFLLGLDLNNEKMNKLLDKALAPVADVNGILNDIDKALVFTGVVSNMEDNDYESKEHLVNKVTKVLSACPEALKDKYIQEKLINMINKYLTDVSFGRLPVKGHFVYGITDLRWMFGHKDTCLQAGEYYFNGKVSRFLIQRSPLTDVSQNALVTTVVDNFYWYLKGIFVFNPYDDTMARLGGADNDGDKFLILDEEDEPILVGSFIPNLPCIIDTKGDDIKDKPKAKKVTDISDRAYIEMFTKFSHKDRIGEITNYCTIARDMMLHIRVVRPNHDITFYRDLSIIGTYHQMWEIDSAKTDKKVEIPGILKIKKKPDWAIEIDAYKANSKKYVDEFETYRKWYWDNNSKDFYTSESFIGYLNREAIKFRLSLKEELKVKDSIDFSYDFKQLINTNDYINLVPVVLRVRKQYNRAIAKVFNTDLSEYDYAKQRKERSKLMGEVVEDYTDYFARLIRDSKLRAVCAYCACYSLGETESKSFVWNCCFDGLLELFMAMGKGYTLRRLSDKFFGTETVEVRNGVFYVDGVLTGNAGNSVMTGIYPITQIDDKNYIKVPTLRSEVLENIIETTGITTYRFSFIGFGFYGLNAKTFMDIIREHNGEFSLVQGKRFLTVVVDGKPLCSISKDDAEAFGTFINGKKLRLMRNISDNSLLTIYDKTPKFINYLVDASNPNNREGYLGAFEAEAYVIGDGEALNENVQTDNSSYSASEVYNIYDENYFESLEGTEVTETGEPVEEALEITSAILLDIDKLNKVTTDCSVLYDITNYTTYTAEEINDEIRNVLGYGIYKYVVFFDANVSVCVIYTAVDKKALKCSSFDKVKAYVEQRLR